VRSFSSRRRRGRKNRPPGPAPTGADARAEAQRFYEAGATSALAEQWDEALPALEQASRLDPRMILAHFGRGQTLMGLRRYTEAVQAYLACREAFRCEATLPAEERAEARRRLDRPLGA
jgi:hypothetical protein